jgi:hypothetical protein
MMGDVNNRIQQFFWTGKQQAQDEVMDYLDLLADHYKNTKVNQGENLGKIIGVLRDVLQQQLQIQRTEP